MVTSWETHLNISPLKKTADKDEKYTSGRHGNEPRLNRRVCISNFLPVLSVQYDTCNFLGLNFGY